MKQCGKGHINYESWKTCPFCSNMENLGKSFIRVEPEIPAEPPFTEVLDIINPGETNIAETEAKKQDVIDDKTVFESEDGSESAYEIDDKTRFEKMTADKTVMESDPGEDKTILDEGTKGPSQLPPFFAWLVFIDEDGKPLHDTRLTRPKSVIGKGDDADVRLKDDFASKLHALIYFEEKTFGISDLGSTNHTWLNEKKIMKEELADGDRIRIGHQQMIFKQVRRQL